MKDAEIDSLLRTYAKFSFGPFEPDGNMVKFNGVYRLPVKRIIGDTVWHGSLEVTVDSNGNPNTMNLGLSLT